MNFMDTTY